MKNIFWKEVQHREQYGKWYFLQFSLKKYDSFSGLWIREPFCIEALGSENFPLLINKHKNNCPQTKGCGWIMRWNELGLYENLKSKSLSDAKIEVKDFVVSYLESLKWLIKDAK